MAEGAQAIQVAVLGGGPGGYAAAFHAADHGFRVTLVDADVAPGGVCLHRGCIPSKALLHVAKLIHEARDAAHMGLSFGPPTLDLEVLRKFKGGVIGKLTGGVAGLCKSRGVTLIRARGRLADAATLALEAVPGLDADVPATLKFDRLILATGSVPAVPAAFRLNDPRVMDSTGALELPDIPKRLLVVGGGYIGLEMGSVYAALGSQVTVVEATDGLLPGADRDLVRPLAKRLETTIHKIMLKTMVAALEAKPEGIVARLEGEAGATTQTFDRALIAIGRRPNTAGLGLEKTRVVVTDKGFVQVDGARRTAEPNIWAIGDLAGEPMLAHKAAAEAKIAVDAIAGEPTKFEPAAIPAVVFTDPELAWAGLTETQAAKEGRTVKTLRFPWAASGRAQTLARVEGLTKLVVDPANDRVLGVGIVGPGAGELIAEGTLAIEMGAVAEDLARTIHAHPTLAETVMEAGEMSGGQAVHFHRSTGAR